DLRGAEGRDLLGDLQLPDEPRAGLVVGRQLRVQQLDRDLPAVLVRAQVHGPLAALADPADQGVRTEPIRITGPQRPNLHAANRPSLDRRAPRGTRIHPPTV